MNNPFDISFGKKPLEVITRFRQSHDILDVFTGTPITQQISIITGVRGSGKTVLMNTIANSLEEDPDWIVVRLNPEQDILPAFAARLSGLPQPDPETAIERMLKVLKERNKRILVTMDEVTVNSHIKAFCHFFQIMIGEELPLFLLMTGLYENIDDLQNEKTLTFLYRAPKLKIEPLNLTMIASRYKEIFQMSEAESVKAASLTRGYSFAFQALGYSMWNYGTEAEKFMPVYRQLLEEYVYEKIWTELSPKDKEIVYGIARSSAGKISEINEILSLKPDAINQYRKRLIRKGIVDGESRGYLYFTLPLFAEYVLQNYKLPPCSIA